MASPEISLVKTTGDEVTPSLTLHYEKYTGTMDSEGIKLFQHRSGKIYQSSYSSFLVQAAPRGKPPHLYPGDSTPIEGAQVAACIYGSAHASSSFNSNWGGPYSNYIIGSSTSVSAVVSYLSFTGLSSIQTIYDYADYAVHHLLDLPFPDTLIYTNRRLNTSYSYGCPVHAFRIASGSDLPSFFNGDSPTHVVCWAGQSVGWHVPVDPAVGWHANSNEPDVATSTRVINGELCFPGNANSSGGRTPLELCYSSSESETMYLSSNSIGLHDHVSVTINVYDEVMQTFAFLSYHRGFLPTVDVRLFLFGTAASNETWGVWAICYPSGLTVRVYTGNISSGSDYDITASGITLDESGIPEDCTNIQLYAGLDNFMVTTLVNIIAPTHMLGCNPPQTSEWPEVVPGYVREVAL